MTLYAITHKSDGTPAVDSIFRTLAFFEEETRAYSRLSNYTTKYQDLYEVRPFTITPQQND